MENRLRNQLEYVNGKNSHVFTFNYTGSATGMETGAHQIFSRSIDKYKLSYSENLGDGDSKSYGTVKDVYNDMLQSWTSLVIFKRG